jgi:hypothetical protein
MISLASIAQQYQQPLLEKYGYLMQTDHQRALKQIIACHTSRAGAMLYHCDPPAGTDTAPRVSIPPIMTG